jgi:O-antigen ligase
MAAGILVLEATRRLRWPVLLLVLALAPAGYATLRIAGSGGPVMRLVDLSGQYFGPNRAESLRIRLVNDDMLTERAMERPWLGWGRWGASRVKDEEGRDITVVDGLWVLLLGTTGLVGLAAAGLLLALPLLALLRAFPARVWDHPQVAPAAALAVVVALWAIDDLLNAMMSPVYPMLAGAVLSLALLVRDRRRHLHRARPAPAPPTAAGSSWA